MSSSETEFREDAPASGFAPLAARPARTRAAPAGHTDAVPSLLATPAALHAAQAPLASAEALALFGHYSDADGHTQGAPSAAGAGAWQGLNQTFRRGCSAVSGATAAASGYVHRAASGLDRGVDWTESQLQRPARWLAEQTRGVPVLGSLAAGGAAVGKGVTELVGGAVKGAGGALAGAADVVLHPVDSVIGLGTLVSHIPGNPLWGIRQLAQREERGGDALAALRDDREYLSNVWAHVAAPYKKAIHDGKPLEAAGRAAVDVGGLLLGTGELRAMSKTAELSELRTLSKAGEATKGAAISEAAALSEAEAISSLGYHPLPGERSMTRAQWKKAHHDARTQASVRELDGGVPGAHGHADHGFQTTLEQQAVRVQTGVTPSGRDSIVGRATRYETPELELEASGRARRMLDVENPPTMMAKGAGGVLAPYNVGYKVERSGGHFGRGVELLPDSNGQPLPGRPVRRVESCARANVVFKFNPATGKWGQYTSFPVP